MRGRGWTSLTQGSEQLIIGEIIRARGGGGGHCTLTQGSEQLTNGAIIRIRLG